MKALYSRFVLRSPTRIAFDVCINFTLISWRAFPSKVSALWNGKGLRCTFVLEASMGWADKWIKRGPIRRGKCWLIVSRQHFLPPIRGRMDNLGVRRARALMTCHDSLWNLSLSKRRGHLFQCNIASLNRNRNMRVASLLQRFFVVWTFHPSL